MANFAMILAAGRSERLGQDKLTALLGGVPVWEWSFRTLSQHPSIQGVGIVCRSDLVGAIRQRAPSAQFVVEGGKTRTESARIGLQHIPLEFDNVLIHDAARPFVSDDLIDRAVRGLHESEAVYPGIPVVDTIKEIVGSRAKTLDRKTLFAVQTPQAAKRGLYLKAYVSTSHEATDDMAMLEAIGIQPQMIPGELMNFKLTTPEDLIRARSLVEAPEIRSGLGYDIHAFSNDPSRPLWLGGVRFEDAPGLEGHSDADVLLHAIVDALLGAAGQGDIGLRYPNTDPRWRNAASSIFLAESGSLMRQLGWEIINIDSAVLAEKPKIMVRREEICRTVASVLEIDRERVSVKATTNERLGSIGRGEGIAAFATATIRRRIGGNP